MKHKQAELLITLATIRLCAKKRHLVTFMLNKQHELRDGKCPLKATIHCIATLDFGLMGRHGLHYLGANYYPFAIHLLLIKMNCFPRERV